jgi:hypothetical protein
MAQTVASGVDGNITFATRTGETTTFPQGKFNYWTLVVGQVVNNITGFDSSGWQEYLGGVKFARFGATFHNKFNAATTNPFGSTTPASVLPKMGCNIIFQVAATCTYTTEAIVESYTLGQDVNGDSVTSVGGPCTGAPTLAWDEAA